MSAWDGYVAALSDEDLARLERLIAEEIHKRKCNDDKAKNQRKDDEDQGGNAGAMAMA